MAELVASGDVHLRVGFGVPRRRRQLVAANFDVPVGPEQPTAVLRPLELRTVLDLADDILAAAREHRRLLDSLPTQAVPGGAETARAYLRGLLAAGQQLPASHAPGATAVAAKYGGPLPPMATTFLAATLGVTPGQVAAARSSLTDALTAENFGPGPLLGHGRAAQAQHPEVRRGWAQRGDVSARRRAHPARRGGPELSVPAADRAPTIPTMMRLVELPNPVLGGGTDLLTEIPHPQDADPRGHSGGAAPRTLDGSALV